MKKTNKLFAAFLLLGLTISGCSLMPTATSRRSKSSSQVQEVNEFDTKTHEIYELYLANGGTLTYEEWLESIKGAKGDKGDKGDQGAKGDKGDKGDQGNPGQDGQQGEKGDKGDPGQDGTNGTDGQTPYIGNNGNWWIGDVDTGVCAGGQNGQDGVSIVSTVINSEGELVITFSDGTTQNVGKLTFTEHVHEYESTVVNPTCTTDGYVTFTCKTCGHIETVINKAQGHIFEAWRESVVATCTSTGLKVRYCSVCGEREQEEIPVHDHVISSSYIYNSAVHWHYCEYCGVVIEEGNHNFVDNTCSTCGCVKSTATSDNGIIYSLNTDGESYTLADFGSCTETEIVIPEYYNGKPVTALGNGAFTGTNIVSVTMSDLVTNLGGNCFKNCTQLKSIVLSRNINAIYEYTFYNCTQLESISIPEGITSIGERAFEGCDAITSIVLPNTVISLNYRAFGFCHNLQRIVLSSRLQNMSAEAFWYCGVTELIIPEGCKEIGVWAFRDTPLQSVSIPSSVTHIGNSAFLNSQLTSAIFVDPTNWRIGSDPLAKEILQDEAVAARKLANSESDWYHNYNY